MDCFDLCSFIVTVDSGRISRIEGDPDHPLTRGFICSKGRDLVDRLYHPDRLRHPMIRDRGGFRKTSYEKILDTIAGKLSSIKDKHGPAAVLNYAGSGYGGFKGRIQNIFFNCFGGATEPEGSLCWGAGMAAQRYDFGAAKGHHPDDILNSDLVLVWGKNPKNTSIHLFSLLKKASKKGSRVIVIDPIKTATAKSFPEYLRIRPATDAVLALSMARVIIDRGLYDRQFVEKYVLGFSRFKEYSSNFTPEKAAGITGIEAARIEELAVDYADAPTASICLGQGMQRYLNGGSSVRCIDALAAITGKIGRSGCGVHYAAKSLNDFVYDIEKKSLKNVVEKRFFTVGQLGRFLASDQDPPVKAAFVSGANPLNQSPDLKTAARNFAGIEFKVVFDHFMTDTAAQADIVIPAASVFEQDDLFITSMYSPFLNCSQKAVDPPQGLMPEFEFYLKLAERLGIDNLGFAGSEEFLEKSAAPLLEKLCRKEQPVLPGEYLRIEENDIAWQNREFRTPSGRIELYSESALGESGSPCGCYIEAGQGTQDFPLRLLTGHHERSMHSQGFAFFNDVPSVFINEQTAEEFNVIQGETVQVAGKRSKINAVVMIDEAICDRTAFMYQGFWHKSGAVNLLSEPLVSDMGKQAAFNDSFVTIHTIQPDATSVF